MEGKELTKEEVDKLLLFKKMIEEAEKTFNDDRVIEKAEKIEKINNIPDKYLLKTFTL